VFVTNTNVHKYLLFKIGRNFLYFIKSEIAFDFINRVAGVSDRLINTRKSARGDVRICVKSEGNAADTRGWKTQGWSVGCKPLHV
jgi:hypothetical protein